MQSGYFAHMNPADMFGLQAGGVRTPASGPPALAKTAGTGALDQANPPWSPDNPLFWFGVLLVVTIGAAAVNASVRIGPITTAIKAGK